MDGHHLAAVCGAPRGMAARHAAGSAVGVHASGRITYDVVCALPRTRHREPTDAVVLSRMLTSQIRERVNHEYPADHRAAALALLERIPAELSVWREVSEGDRVEAAALTVAAGDLGRLSDAVTLALRDWRDLLMSAS